jgi:outer membrane immunogenic protein
MKGRQMRWLVCVLIVLGFAPHAFAADLDDLDVLRGSEPVGPAAFTNWTGFYVGGDWGYTNDATDFSNATNSLVAFSLRETTLEQDVNPSSWSVLGNASTTTTTPSGFAGYNSQWQNLILGLEADYAYASTSATATTSPISRQVSAGGSTYDVTVEGSASMRLVDYASLRARAGWILNNFLPYGFIGFVVGRGDVTRTSLVFGQENPSSPPVVPCNFTLSPTCVDFSYPNSESQNNAILYGGSVGLGLDYALTSNIFLRGEIEYVRFLPLDDILVTLTSARIGGGFKF